MEGGCGCCVNRVEVLVGRIGYGKEDVFVWLDEDGDDCGTGG